MSVKEKAGEFFLDIAKLVFGGIILSGIVNEPINKWVIFCQVGRYKGSQTGRKETGKRETKF